MSLVNFTLIISRDLGCVSVLVSFFLLGRKDKKFFFSISRIYFINGFELNCFAGHIKDAVSEQITQIFLLDW